jgi:hypothetical protein
MASEGLEKEIFRRCEKFLPKLAPKRKGGDDEVGLDEVELDEPLCLNRRLRCYRYIPGRYYRPHIDGAWPPSGLDSKGNYVYDMNNSKNANGLQFVKSDESQNMVRR